MQPTAPENPNDKRLREGARLLPPEDGAFLVGGCVRDLLIGKPPADYDVAVSSGPESYARRLAERHGGRPVAIGPARHRIFRVVAGDRVFDVSPLAGSSIAADLHNRDFTINAMAFDLTRQALIDPENGRADLRNRVIRMVSPAAFTRDPLRQLRAFRLAAQFTCRIEPQTVQAVKNGAGTITRCAGERIRTELLKMLAISKSVNLIEQMAACGLLFDILPELAPLQSCRQNAHHSFDAWTHTLVAFRRLEALIDPDSRAEGGSPLDRAVQALHDGGRTGLLKMALLLHDVGKPATRSVDEKGQVHFYGHGRRGAAIAADICRRLRFSRQAADYINGVIRHHNRPLFLFLLNAENNLSDRAVTRFFIHCAADTPDILLHALADYAGKHRMAGQDLADFTDFTRTLLTRYSGPHTRRLAGPGLITGHDLITAFDLSPSPLFKKILDSVETARLAGEISEKQQALDLARQLLDQHGHFPPG